MERKDLLEAKYNQDWAAEAYKDYIKKIGEANFSEDLKNFLVKQYGRNLTIYLNTGYNLKTTIIITIELFVYF